MNHSTHYNLNLAEGTDLVNPLTIDVPNYQTIDSTMYTNEQAGVGTATELKTGTIHAITRANQNRNVFKFTASSIFNAGDTFTVDGSTVTALYPDQSSLKDRCFIVGSDVLCLLTGSQLTLLTTYFPEASTVTFNDANVSYTANNVQSAIENASTATGTEYSTGVSVKTQIDKKAGKLIQNTLSSTSFSYDNAGKYWYSNNPITTYYGTRKVYGMYVVPSYSAINANAYINSNNHICVAGIVTTNMQVMDSQYTFNVVLSMEEYS